MGPVAFLCDPHFGDNTHNENGVRVRVAVQLVDEVSRVLEDESCEALVIPGDLFHRAKPEPWAYLIANRLRTVVRKLKIPMYVLAGNHDAAKPGEVGPLQVLFGEGELVTEPRGVSIGGHRFFFMPWVSKAYLASRITDQRLATQQDAMVALLSMIAQDNVGDEPTVLVTHYTIAGATYNSDVQPLLGEASEVLLPTSAVRGYALVVAGHVHKRQTFANVIYPGAAARHDFGEEDSQPALALLDAQAGVFEYHDLPALEFKTFEIQYEQTEKGESYHLLRDTPIDVDEKVVRLKGELPAGPRTSEVIADFREELLKAGALKVLDSAISYVRHEHREVSTTTTSTTPEAALDEYIGAVGGEFADNRDSLMLEHMKMVEEVRGEE